MSTVLITGATGFLGPYLIDAFESMGRVVGVARSSIPHHCDLTDRASVHSLFREFQPDIVVHAAALTDVDLCQKNPALADQINRGGTEILVGCLPPKAKLLYISTDQVYPGVHGPYSEESEGPVNVYGATKYAGEEAARQHPQALILRINLFGISRGRTATSLVDFLIEKFRRRESLTLFTDVFFSPLHVKTMTMLAVECIRQQLVGTFNLGSRNGMSKCDFALAIAHHLGLSTENSRRVESTSILARAPRPLDMRMDVSRIEGALRRPMPSLAEEIKKL